MILIAGAPASEGRQARLDGSAPNDAWRVFGQ